MKELNRHNLTNALERLPEHTPPSMLWEQLEEKIDTENLLQKTIARLPEYAAPEAIWENIEARLEPAKLANPKIVRITWRYAAAAAFVLLLAAVWFVRTGTSGAFNTRVSVHEEILDEHLLEVSREPEDDAFALIDQLCAERLPVCEQPEFKSLRDELNELTTAKTELREALGNYGDDPELHAQLIRIERERSDVLRQMMNLI